MPGVWLLSCLCYYDFKCAVKAGGLQAPANLTKFCSWEEFPIYDAAPRQQQNRCRWTRLQWSLFFFFYRRSQDENTEGAGSAGSAAPENPVVCEVEDSFTCSVALDDTAGFATMVAVSVSGAVVPPVLLTIPARPGEWQDSLYPCL